ncbi:MAG: 6-carboxyhexanoate--CoA ligase, partial [bacterium]|nr:6-carboxyhexanoate--CoA ligase [bacterium]
VETGERLEPDKERGVRTVRVDWKNRRSIEQRLKERGIKRYYINRLLDALALATKNVYCGVISELCWSDDPDYTTGYVAGKNIGYIRIKPMKEYGVPLGGRVYFVRKDNLHQLIECLEKRSVLVEGL